LKTGFSKISFNNKAIRIASHLLFWVVAYLFFITFYGKSNNDFRVNVYFVSMLFPVAIATTYLLIYYLIPRFLLQSRYFIFFLLLVYLIIFTECLSMVISLFIFMNISDYNISALDPTSYDVMSLIVGLYFVCLIAVAIKQVKRAFMMQRQNAELAKTKLETELKLKEAELNLLRAQIHPHFLFNTLNNLYGLTLEKSELAPELVLRLSGLLDYMLYRCNKPQVLLKDELEQLQNYMELEQIRYGKGLRIENRLKGDVDGLFIAPMMLFPFVENAFKHGVSKQTGNPFIEMNIEMNELQLHFTLVNSCTIAARFEEEYTKGIGLKNVTKRLEMIYPGKHELKINPQENQFQVALKLTL